LASSWFEHYGNQRNGLNHSVVNAQKTPTVPYNVPKASWCMENNSTEHRAESGQPLVPSTVNAVLMRRPKKRKSTESALVSWHKITEGTKKLRKMR
jgi:hypothetical protein